ncbi:ATP-binding protein [Streptomyces sp. cg28]|uniref:ATP-binding protein n=1 Tax=Streptomyces sp. cg28 TaxID=3403457 RepID=UPI003B22210B
MAEDSTRPAVNRMHGQAEGNARIYMAGRDLHISAGAGAGPAQVAVLRTLPRGVAHFTGRDDELSGVVAAARVDEAKPEPAPAICAVDGMAGVGKTALVIHAAHLLADEYPDGQLFVDLCAHTSGREPAAPTEVLAQLLIASGISPKDLPENLMARSALWRDRLAGRRSLIVLDNAADRAQVEPLIPGAGRNGVLITSRRRLMGLEGASHLSLDMLSSEKATLLFGRLSRRAITEADGSSIAELVRSCGNLPLAIALLASRLAHHPTWEASSFAQEFSSAKDHLGELEAGDLRVTAAFDLSYRNLSHDRKLLFRLIGVHPGPDIDIHALAAMSLVPVTKVRRDLEALYVDHLIDEVSPHRFSMHDLLREYTYAMHDQEPGVELNMAMVRLLDHYRDKAEAAEKRLAHWTRPGVPDDDGSRVQNFSGRESALSWLRNERANLIACIGLAVRQGMPHIGRMTATLATLLRLDGPWEQAVDLHNQAAASAQSEGDRLGAANALMDLGDIQLISGDQAASIDSYTTAMGDYRKLHNPLGEANSINSLGHARKATGEPAVAAALHAEALSSYRNLGDYLGEANALHDLGRVRQVTGEYVSAWGLQEEALALYRALGNQFGEANTINDLGRIKHAVSSYSAAAELHAEALTIYRHLGSRLGEANALHDLGRNRQATGEYAVAGELHEEALALYRVLGNQLGEANTLNDLGRIEQVAGNRSAAAKNYQDALALYRSLGDRLGEANALHDLGRVRQETCDFTDAADLYDQARGLFVAVGDPDGEAEVWNSIGSLMLHSGDVDEALSAYCQAQELALRVHNPLTRARALQGGALCLARDGQRREAILRTQQALAIFRELDAPDVGGAVAQLVEIEA